MTDWAVSLGQLVANGLWVAVAVLLILAWILNNELLAETALAISAAAATATVRCYFVTQNQMMMEIFKHGRDSASVVSTDRKGHLR